MGSSFTGAVWDALDDTPKSVRAIGRLAGVSHHTAQAALRGLQGHSGAFRGTSGWVRGPVAPESLTGPYGGTPRFAVVVWISPQLREYHPELPLSLDEAIVKGRDHEAT
jgi:hypothetical protein